jgi:predicted secreted acid phosphatase
MGPIMKKIQILMIAVCLCIANLSLAKEQLYSPDSLNEVTANVALLHQHKKVPVVVFDLDDTLLDARERSFRVIQDFANQSEIQEKFPKESKKIKSISIQDLHWGLEDSFKSIGIMDERLIQKAKLFWSEHFFTNEYCKSDRPILGAVEYVKSVYVWGAKVVYLTGRDSPRMKNGTEPNLKSLGFPLDSDRAVLLLKPSATGDDLMYKVAQVSTIKEMGKVIAVFENEPANINAFQQAFPQAKIIFVDTVHSPKPDMPNPGVIWIRDFQK